MRPIDYRKCCIIIGDTPYHVEKGESKGTHSASGVLRIGRVVWTRKYEDCAPEQRDLLFMAQQLLCLDRRGVAPCRCASELGSLGSTSPVQSEAKSRRFQSVAASLPFPLAMDRPDTFDLAGARSTQLRGSFNGLAGGPERHNVVMCSDIRCTARVLARGLR